MKVFKKLQGQQDFYFLGNYSQITNNVIEYTKEFISTTLYNGNKKQSLWKSFKGLKQKSSLILPPDPGSETQAIKRANLQMKIWLQSLSQNMILSSFGQNGWKR